MYLYDHASRLVRTVTEGAWTAEDRALMLAWREYQRSLCEGCGHEKAKAWHPDNEGWLKVPDDRQICWACTAIREAQHEGSSEPVKPVEYLTVIDTRDYNAKPLPPLLVPTKP